MYQKRKSARAKRLPRTLIIISFIGTVTDALAGVFLLIPVGLYNFLYWPPESVYFVFVTGAINSYIEDILVVIVSLVVCVPLLSVLRRIQGLKLPLT